MIKKIEMKNKGFTIVELLIALSISSLVIGLIFFILISNYKNYKAMKAMSELQFQSQYILNYMSNKIINSNSISFIGTTDSSYYSLTAERVSGVEYRFKTIYFKYGNKEDENYVFQIVGNNIRYGTRKINQNPTDELGKYVDSMYVSLLKDGSFGSAKVVKIKVHMMKDGHTYEAYQTAYMRNN